MKKSMSPGIAWSVIAGTIITIFGVFCLASAVANFTADYWAYATDVLLSCSLTLFGVWLLLPRIGDENEEYKGE